MKENNKKLKICVFSDIHGNIDELLKLTQSYDFKNADMRICLGDVVGLGPYQKECMDELSRYDCVMLLGNHEARMINNINDVDPIKEPITYQHFEVYKKQLSQYMDYFKSLPINYDIVLGNKKVRFTHYGWYNGNMSNKNFNIKNKSLDVQFGLLHNQFDYVFYGHIHTPSTQFVNGIQFVDVGSLGLKCPGNYLMINVDGDQFTFERKIIPYDKNMFLDECKKLNFPRWELLLDYSFDNTLEKVEGNVLVTGGAGYIGSNVVNRLVGRGYRVVIADDFSNSYPKHINDIKSRYPDLVTLYNVDLLDYDQLNKILVDERIYSVMHLAGKKYVAESFLKQDEYYKDNVVMTKQLLELMTKNKIKKLVFSSSITVYGKTSSTYIDENEKYNPLSPYAQQKVECEKLVSDWASIAGNEATILRLSNPVGACIVNMSSSYGLGDDAKNKSYIGVLPYIVDSVQSKKALKFNGGDHPTKDGTTVRDYIHVEDVAHAFVNALEKNGNGLSIYNIGSGANGYSVLDILKNVEKCLNIKVEYSFGPKRDGDTSIIVTNNTKAKDNIDFCVTKNLYDMVNSQIEFETKYKN